MARPREFDAEQVLERAMLEFWSRGYEACSVDELCTATGVSRSSLYASFGDKQALLLSALDRYSEIGSARLLSYFRSSRALRTSLAALLHDFIQAIVDGPGRRGCFIGNCAVELARHDRAALLRVRQSLRRIESNLQYQFEQARTRGELAPQADCRALARYFMSGLQGLRLVGTVEADRGRLEDIAALMLSVLDRPREQ